MNNYVMLQRNLIYTGMTRAKRILVMVGTMKALAYAVNNVSDTKRNTLLKERLAGECSVPGEAHKLISYPEKSYSQSLRVAEESNYLIKEDAHRYEPS